MAYDYQGFRTIPRTIPKHYLFVTFLAIERLSHTPESDWCIVCRKISDTFLARWFKVTFLSPSWRSLNLPKGSFNHPKKVTKNCLEGVILHYFASLTVLFFSNCMVVKLIQAGSVNQKLTTTAGDIERSRKAICEYLGCRISRIWF